MKSTKKAVYLGQRRNHLRHFLGEYTGNAVKLEFRWYKNTLNPKDC